MFLIGEVWSLSVVCVVDLYVNSFGMVHHHTIENVYDPCVMNSTFAVLGCRIHYADERVRIELQYASNDLERVYSLR